MRFKIKFLIFINTFLISSAFSNQSACSINQLYDAKEGLNIGLLVKECTIINPSAWTYINSAIWTVNRLNGINFTTPLNVGLTIFQTCTDMDDYNAIYKLFLEKNERHYLRVFSDHPTSNNLNRFSDVLETHLSVTDTYQTWMIEAAVKFLLTLDPTKNITVYTENQNTLSTFHSLTRIANICINNAFIFDTKANNLDKPNDGIVIVFGGYEMIKLFLVNFTQDDQYDMELVFVPLDASANIDFPEGSYVIQPLFSENTDLAVNSLKFTASPILFNIADPILEAVMHISEFIFEYCNETVHKINCIRKKYSNYIEDHVKVKPQRALNMLNIEQLADTFVYNIFRVENLTLHIYNLNSSLFSKVSVLQSFVNVFTYSIFNKTLVASDFENMSNVDREPLCPRCRLSCVNFIQKPTPKTILVSYVFSKFGLRTESWVFGFLAISLLGVIFSIAVFIFITVRIYKKDILEGNPFLTIMLLFTVILMYCSVIPFALETDREARNYICIAKALSTTLIYAFAFSLILSRSILLATISKEVGFMAHVPGPVQSFLTLFIFAVQGALSLQFINHCEDIFRGVSFVYLMSYNVILIILLLVISPLNTRSQRNYKEGRYFTVAVALIACIWSCWLPGYAVFDKELKDPMLCLGLVSTASILLGAIFIPRTYMMTVAATRDRLTSALPSLQHNSSIVDVYRASAQPIYDCINITAINARCGPPAPPPLPHTDVYSSLTAPYEEEYDFERSVTPNADKVTRF